MNENEADTPPPPPSSSSSSLRRPKSIPTSMRLPIPTSLTLPNVTASTFDFLSLKSSSHSYTSLKDLLPSFAAALDSPNASSAANEISIRNRLVKLAAWAYLQPMAASPGSSGPHLFRRIWIKLSSVRTSLSSCLRFVISHIISGLSRALDWFLGAMWVLVHK